MELPGGPWLETVLLCAVRVTAFIVIAPPFSHSSFPMRIRAMLGVGLGLAIAARPGLSGRAALDTAALLGAIAAEALTGLVLGFLVYLAFAALQSAGSLIDLFAGLQMATVYDPGSLVNGAQFTRLVHMAGLALLISSDGYQLVLAGLAGSFDAVPLGGQLDLARPVEAMLAASSGLLVAALQIAGPLLAVLFLADVGLGLLTRIDPALNAFQMGFPLKVLLTLLLAGTLFLALPAVVAALAGQAARALTGVG
ncbi:flagellar biosynthetic protein FliR [Sinomonas halotolerans]|uniref:Flagellar biosynthetic protein FliR n=1 Tax=Sinomonas halotolerans TaxID=1644133 RepID=A0ABU9WYP4_9MICC